MLTTRLWMGSVLIALVVGMLVVDQHAGWWRYPWPYPFQMVFQLLLAYAGCRELNALLGKDRGTIVPLTYVAVIALTLSNWVIRGANVSYFTLDFPIARWTRELEANLAMWSMVIGLVVVIHLAIFLWEMATYRGEGGSFERMARTWWVIGYVGLLPVFFAQIRWLYPQGHSLGTSALALAIFVPKGCDIGAYFIGKAIGKHRMTPVLSPNKTWEGAVGGLTLAALITIGIDRLGPAPVLRENWVREIAFGLTVGVAGMLGDLAESLIKRDCQKKDASHVMPGFGGVLDVVDSVVFAAPLAYAWFAIAV